MRQDDPMDAGEQRLVRDAVAGRPLATATGLDAHRVGAAYEEVLAQSGRRRSMGAFYTPSALIEFLLDQTLQPLLEQAHTPADVLRLRVLDPACGVGLFLVAATRRISARLAQLGSSADPAAGIVGIDLDPVAARLTKALLPKARIHTADALLADPLSPHSFDVVVGNPPFLNRLQRHSALSAESSRQVAEMTGTGPYTDVSAVFLARTTHWLRAGGRAALVQPISVLSARDAEPVRRLVGPRLQGVWIGNSRTFAAGVHVCAVVLGPIARTEVKLWGPDFEGYPPQPAPRDGSWGPLLASVSGVPLVELGGAQTLGALADCTADFRDQYYGLVDHVREGGPGHRLVTSGLIDPLVCHWGTRPTRFAKQRYQRPTVGIDQLPDQLRQWAHRRLVPKVLVATQGKVLEAVADPHGEWLPSVPVISVVPRVTDDLWRIVAVLASPPVSAWAANRYAGAGLNPDAVKLSARQIASIPLPVNERAWQQGADLFAAASCTGEVETAMAAGRSMCQAYDVPEDPVLSWWRDRLGRP